LGSSWMDQGLIFASATGTPLGRETVDEAADRLFALLLDVASGSATWGEILDESDEVFVRLGPSF